MKVLPRYCINNLTVIRAFGSREAGESIAPPPTFAKNRAKIVSNRQTSAKI